MDTPSFTCDMSRDQPSAPPPPHKVGALKLDGLLLAIYFDLQGEQELHPTVLDVVGRQHKLFHPRGTTESTVLSVETILLHICKRSALQALVSSKFCVADLQSSKEAKVSSAKIGLLHLKNKLSIQFIAIL